MRVGWKRALLQQSTGSPPSKWSTSLPGVLIEKYESTERPMELRQPSRAITHAGVFKSTDSGSTWSPSGAALLGSKFVTSLAVDPRHPEMVYAGLSSAGAFKSSDGGATWSSALNGFPFPQISVNALSVDPTNSVVYAATSFKVFKSTDGAAAWTEAGVGFGPNASFVNSFAMDPNSHTTLYAGTARDGVYTSLDAGATWTPLSDGLSGFSLNVLSLAVDPSNRAVLYAGTGGRSVQQ